MTSLIKTIKEMAEKLITIFPASSLPPNGPEKPKLIFCVRGSSGAIMGGLITPFLPDYEVVINHVKKEGENSHSNKNDKPYLPEEWPRIILDDFILTGETVEAIYRDMQKVNKDIHVDCLCVSGEFNQSDITFAPEYIIAGGYCRTL